MLVINAPTPIYSAPGIVDTSGRYAEGEHFYFDQKEIPYMGNGVEAAYFSLGLDCWVMRIGGELQDAHDKDTTLLPAARRNQPTSAAAEVFGRVYLPPLQWQAAIVFARRSKRSF